MGLNDICFGHPEPHGYGQEDQEHNLSVSIKRLEPAARARRRATKQPEFLENNI